MFLIWNLMSAVFFMWQYSKKIFFVNHKGAGTHFMVTKSIIWLRCFEMSYWSMTKWFCLNPFQCICIYIIKIQIHVKWRDLVHSKSDCSISVVDLKWCLTRKFQFQNKLIFDFIHAQKNKMSVGCHITVLLILSGKQFI